MITSANEIVASLSFELTEYSAIYPITPSTTMGEEYSKLCNNHSNYTNNIFNISPKVDVMQSETGAISSCAGALFGGTYSTTFTSSQGLLLMIPNMYKMASSLKPFVLNVASRSLSTHALNIFCDHSDIYSTLSTGFSILCASNTQKAQDFCMISHMLTLKSKIPVLHFFDGFITSHKLDVITPLKNKKNLFPMKEFYEFKKSCLSATNPKVVGTNQNPDIYFQNRERIEEYVQKVPQILNECFEEFYKQEGRKYQIFDYFGPKNASNIVISMGSSVETLKNVLNYLDDSFGVVGVNLLNPFCINELLKVLPKTTKIITVLDRTKQAGHNYEYLAQSVVAGLKDKNIKILCGRYGLGGKDFDLNMAKSVFINMITTQKNHFTVGIDDDISNSSLEVVDENFEDDIKKYAFFGVGGDGMVSASKFFAKELYNNQTSCVYVCENSYYDSKKSGGLTESQVFVSNKKFEINYKEKYFDFLTISNAELLSSFDILKSLKPNSTILINATTEQIEKIPDYCKNQIATKNCKLFIVDADGISKEYNLVNKTNLIMITSFFILTCNENTKKINDVQLLQFLNDASCFYFNKQDECDNLINLTKYLSQYFYPESWKNETLTTKFEDYSQLPVSNFNANGEFKNVNKFYPLTNFKACWNENKCVKCTNCAQICPHNAISIKLVETNTLKNAPKDFKFIENGDGTSFCLFVDTQKCTGCENCAKICPTKAISLKSYLSTSKEYFESLTPIINNKNEKNFAFSQSYYSCNSACSGCQEIMYYKLLGSLFGSHLNIINATGCSSIYNGGVNCSPFKTDSKGFGTSFVSNLFEDNAEFGYGLTNGYNSARKNFISNITENLNNFGENFKNNLQEFLENYNDFQLCQKIYENLKNIDAQNKFDEYVKNNIHFIIPMVNFIVGGDGWAYDIDFGGLDHVVSLNKNVNILILDNEIYSNTGGQTSKATNLGAKTKYTDEKQTPKKDLFLSLFQYKNLYFSKVNFGANKNQCIKSFQDAVNHDGPSIILAYTPCINHKINMNNSVSIAKNAVKSGYFNLMTYKDGKLTLESTPDFSLLKDFLLSEGRYKLLSKNSLVFENNNQDINSDEIKNSTLENLINTKKQEYEFYKKLSEILK